MRAPPGSLDRVARYGFTTRAGGVSRGARSSLHLAHSGDSEETLTNWRRALLALHPDTTPDALVLMHQVHGGQVARVSTGTGPLEVCGEVDAVVTTEPGLVLAVRVADCVPVLLGCAGGVAAVHAGWRGTVAGVVPAAVAALVEATGQAPSALAAVIGPHVQLEAYEVGDEVIEGLVGAGVPAQVAGRKLGRWHADLGASVEWQLRQVGLGEVQHLGRCTSEADFFSYRHDGPHTGRQAGLIRCG